MKDVCPHCKGKELPLPTSIRLYQTVHPPKFVLAEISMRDYNNIIDISVLEPTHVVGIGLIRPNMKCVPLKLNLARALIAGDTLSISGAMGCSACGNEGTASAAVRRKIEGFW